MLNFRTLEATGKPVGKNENPANRSPQTMKLGSVCDRLTNVNFLHLIWSPNLTISRQVLMLIPFI